MKLPGWIVAGAAVVAAAPAPAQNVSDTQTFIQAIEDQDNATAMQILRDRPSVLNARNRGGQTALMIAVNARDGVWTRYLVQEGASPTYANGEGDIPLIAAARIGWGEAIEWMLDKNANVDATNRKGETALIVAVQQRRAPIVEMLLENGADPDIADSVAGYSARDYAKRDSRSQRMLELIEAADKAGTKAAAAKKPDEPVTLENFKLK